MTAAQFEREINEWYEANASPSGGALDWMRQVLLDLCGETIDRWPVKTGRSKGEWQLGLGSKPTGLVRRRDPVGGQTLLSAVRVLMSIPEAGQPLFWVNNSSYASFIEDGSSSQAPQGSLLLAMATVESRYGVTREDLGQISKGQYMRPRAMARSQGQAA